MSNHDYGPGVMPDRRERERRAMPAPVRAVYVKLLHYTRAAGAVSGGIEWVAVPKQLLRESTECLERSWRAEPDLEASPRASAGRPGHDPVR